MHVKLSENFRAVFYAPFYATHALGFYTGEGVEVELLNSPAPAKEVGFVGSFCSRVVRLDLG